MAKKVLTPEQQEIKAMKKAKKSQNRTKFWAIVLALVLTLGIAFAGKSQGEKNKPETQTVNSNDSDNNNSSNSNDDNSNTPGSSDDDSNTPASDDGNSNSDSNTPDSNDGNSNASSDKMDEAAVAAAINKATGEAVKAKVGYDWERNCTVKDVDVGSLTSPLNSLIKGLDKKHEATVDSVVGGFLGNGDRRETIKKGETLETMKNGDGEPYYHGKSYTLKATNLKASDIKNLKIDGDKFSFDIPDSQNPERNGNTPLSRFTNDIVVRSEVESEIQGFTDRVTISRLQANYKNIKASVTIKDGKLVEITYSFYADAELDIKLGIKITGTGNLTTNAKYSNFKY